MSNFTKSTRTKIDRTRMLYHSETIKIYKQLHAIKKDLIGGITFSLGGLSILIEDKDRIGSLIEEWFRKWAHSNHFNISPPKTDCSSQEFPDFYIWGTSKTPHLLEIKTFEADAWADFDIANLQSYCHSS